MVQYYINLSVSLNLRPIDLPEHFRPNYWFNCVSCDAKAQRFALTKVLSGASVMTRPIWTLMTRLPLYTNALRGPLDNAEWLEARVVNLPSSVLPEANTQ